MTVAFFFNFQFSTINAQCVHTILFYGFKGFEDF